MQNQFFPIKDTNYKIRVSAGFNSEKRPCILSQCFHIDEQDLDNAIVELFAGGCDTEEERNELMKRLNCQTQEYANRLFFNYFKGLVG